MRGLWHLPVSHVILNDVDQGLFVSQPEGVQCDLLLSTAFRLFISLLENHWVQTPRVVVDMYAYTGSRTQSLHLQMCTALRTFPEDHPATYIHTVAIGKLEL
jgi:hypothetical protein